MPLSLEKCLVIHYGLHNSHYDYNCRNYTLNNKNSFSDLDIVRSCEGDFREHIASTVQKAHRLSGLCFRELVNRNSEFLVRLYKTYIWPILINSSPIWSPIQHQDVNLLENFNGGLPNVLLATKICHTVKDCVLWDFFH